MSDERESISELSRLIDKYLLEYASYSFLVDRNEDDEYVFKFRG